ncbi:glycosyl hydrolase 115 family protein [Sphingomonas sp. BGYR3]|uniref:glycosyl hydrolase 115 family protein n=1 Tax=Sphingomonas sp. BGYR3 TaxID=2975483 RepID=UPI0021A7AAE9|nr:glycosyl hydrolase 115 family protein [Sphingomonas sp. BGYR3]MDG5489756.1 glycosyl hydrolase 115 family protein [Sphingomonas sp. BGYR3]
MRAILVLLVLLLAPPAWAGQDWVAFDRGPGFALIDQGRAAPVITDAADHSVVTLAAAELRADLGRVGGGSRDERAAPILAGTIGKSALIDRMIAAGRVDASPVRGRWEGYAIALVDRPMPGVARALVVIGGDPRGTAYGLMALSRAIGVSPWHWWADVTPGQRAHVRIRPGTRIADAPDVRYRGFFINDEDWGLVPWAALTHAPGERPIGPRTNERIFQLMLRLRANLLWPGMHKVTAPFNADPANAALADRYAIVMGSSHAEPMLRNNVGEWPGAADAFDYVKNRDGVRAYWSERVAANARYESIWTLGMRGIHDSGMVGPSSPAEQRATLERIFADQRAMLAQAGAGSAPQLFTPYKEVLDIYRSGLAVPDDVTLMWPDDNFGYIRQFPNDAERRRSGGSGIYYHLSYLGAPLSYLWLSTTPPALIREEMGRAWDLGARRIWVANAGDIKPAELALGYFLDLAWDVAGTRAQPIDDYVARWAAEAIDPALAPEIAAVMAEHHRLNLQRRPEHLQWFLPHGRARPSTLSPADVADRMAAFEANVARLDAIEARVPAHRRDAFFQLVRYPVEAAMRANERVFAAELHDRLRDRDLAAANGWAARAQAADDRIRALTSYYNGAMAGGKWRGIMAPEPADGQWRSYRTLPVAVPVAVGTPALPRHWPTEGKPASVVVEAEAARGNWRIIDGLGTNGTVIGSRIGQTVRGTLAASLPPGRWRMAVDLLPTYADRDGRPLELTIEMGGRSFRVGAKRETGNDDWKQAVLDNRLTLTLPEPVDGGDRRIVLGATGGGVIVDRLVFSPF